MIINFIRRIPDFVFLIWAIIFAVLFFTEDYLLYLRPSLVFLIVVGFFFSILFFAGGFSGQKRSLTTAQMLINALMLLLPILFYYSSRDTTLGSFAYTRKRTALNQDNLASQWKKIVVADKNTLHQATLVQLTSPMFDFSGALIETEGIVYRDDNIGHLVIYRFVVTCCAADARPLGVYLPLNDLTHHLKKDDWVKVQGRFNEDVIQGGKKIKVIYPNHVEVISAPPSRHRYLYN